MKHLNCRTRRFLTILAGITVLGLLIRLLVSWQLIGNDPFAYDPPSVTDMATYHQQSDDIRHGIFPKVFYYQPFYYSVFLPVCKFVFRSSVWGAAVGQALCSGGIIWLCGLCAALLRGRRSGIFAAILACFSAMLIFYVPYVLIEIQQAFWFTLLFYLTLQGYRKNKTGYWAGAGIILSFAVLSRGNAWCFLPWLVAAIWLAGKKQALPFKRQQLNLLVLFLCAVLPQLPFIITNSVAGGKLTGPSTAGPTVLALGNNPEAPAGHLVYPETYNRWFEQESERSVVGSIADWALEEPGAFLELQFRKFLLYWDAGEIPNNVSWENNASKSNILLLTGKVSGGIILFLALGAFLMLLRSARYHKGVLLLMGYCLFYALAAAAFYILARFRVPSLGLLIIMGAFLPDLLWRRCRRHAGTVAANWSRPVLACAQSAFVVYGAYDFYRNYYESPLMKILRPYGVQMEFCTAGMLLLDHGPRELGNWNQISWNPGGVLQKKFVFKNDHWQNYPRRELEITLYGTAPGSLIFRVNGKRQVKDFDPDRKTGVGSVTLDSFELAHDGSLTVELVQSTVPDFSFLVDLQRDYGRTIWQNETFPGEAVCRLRFLPADLSQSAD